MAGLLNSTEICSFCLITASCSSFYVILKNPRSNSFCKVALLAAPQLLILVTPTLSISLKYACLAVLVIQTSVNVLTLRYTRLTRGHETQPYIASTAVLLSEFMKLIICSIVLFKDVGYDTWKLSEKISIEVFSNKKDSLKLLVPALLYVVQNNLLYIALTNLDAATYQCFRNGLAKNVLSVFHYLLPQKLVTRIGLISLDSLVTYQMKILTTALFSVMMLNKKLNSMKWLSLVVLMIGVIFVQWPTKTSQGATHTATSQIIGVIAVLAACVSSGFSGVYFEKILKESPISMWMRNLQLAFFSIIIAFAGVLINDFTRIQDGGFFQGYRKIVFLAIFFQSINGLIIGAVVKYADNILKGFATSISIVVSSVISYYILQDFIPTWFFIFGSGGVLLATYLYSLPERKLKPPTTPEPSEKEAVPKNTFDVTPTLLNNK